MTPNVKCVIKYLESHEILESHKNKWNDNNKSQSIMQIADKQ